jgi:hypothetical protein
MAQSISQLPEMDPICLGSSKKTIEFVNLDNVVCPIVSHTELLDDKYVISAYLKSTLGTSLSY